MQLATHVLPFSLSLWKGYYDVSVKRTKVSLVSVSVCVCVRERELKESVKFSVHSG